MTEIIQVSSGMVEVDVEKIIIVEAHSGMVEVDAGAREIIETTNKLEYVSNKMTFVVGSNSGAPVGVGIKNTYGTRFGDGIITRWTLMTNVVTDLSVNILRSIAFPVFSPILNASMTGNDYATGVVAIPLANMDILNFEVVSNTAASKITMELLIR